MVKQIEHQIYAIVVLDNHFSENKYAEKLELVLSTKKKYSPNSQNTNDEKEERKRIWGVRVK